MRPNKKRKAAASSRDVGEADVSKEALEQGASSDEKSDSHDNSQDIVNVDFEFFDPRPDDYHGVKALLRTYVDDVKWDLGGFVDVILSQTTVGTVIKTAEDESPIGVISVLNLGRYKFFMHLFQWSFKPSIFVCPDSVLLQRCLIESLLILNSVHHINQGG